MRASGLTLCAVATADGKQLQCSKCQQLFGSDLIVNRMRQELRKHIASYYEYVMVCTDATCGHSSRQLPPMTRAELKCINCHSPATLKVCIVLMSC